MGNIVVGQSGGPTAAINSSLTGVIKGGLYFNVPKIYGMRNGIEGFMKGDIIDLKDAFPNYEGLSVLRRTPASFLGTCRYKLPPCEGNEEIYETIFQRMEEKDITALLYIGGNDSMDTIQSLSDYAASHGKPQRFIGIPKTIDNDLPVTDHTPGYGSAAKFIATMTKEIIRDTESFGGSKSPKISIVEIMGRNAGWLTAASALSRAKDCVGPDLIYFPELDFDKDDFLSRVDALAGKKKSIVICASEGIHGKAGALLSEDSAGLDAFGHSQLSGAGRVLGDMIKNGLGLKNRTIEFSILQRCASHLASGTDIDEAFNVGFEAVRAAENGETGRMITINVEQREPYIANYKAADIHGIANEEKRLPLTWITPDGVNVTDEFLEYARPLIDGYCYPHYANGVPKHVTLYNANMEESGKIE